MGAVLDETQQSPEDAAIVADFNMRQLCSRLLSSFNAVASSFFPSLPAPGGPIQPGLDEGQEAGGQSQGELVSLGKAE